jgi:hypothetical protein
MALLERLRWRLRMLRLALRIPGPIIGAEDDPPDDDPEPKDDPPKGGSDPDPKPDDDPDKVTPDDDWQAKARKHERAAKKERKAREELEQKLKEREDEEKSERDKAIDKAREEAKAEVLTEVEKERRGDRLETAVTRLSKGIKIGDGDDAKTVRFADEDVLLRIERQLRSEDIDSDDLYDSEGKVNTDTLRDAAEKILAANPHLVTGDGKSKPSGDADTRKGDTAKSDLESMSPEDHEKRKYGDKK